jgi:pimeloyl-ACP methyl ester carboxylesterase
VQQADWDLRKMPTIQTSLLEISYRDDGSRDAPVILLLHGWPDDSSTWDAIIPSLNNAGLRTIAPTMRGFGETRFLSPDSPRTGNAAIASQDRSALRARNHRRQRHARSSGARVF